MEQEARQLELLIEEDSLSLPDLAGQETVEVVTSVNPAEVLPPDLFRGGDLISFLDEEYAMEVDGSTSSPKTPTSTPTESQEAETTSRCTMPSPPLSEVTQDELLDVVNADQRAIRELEEYESTASIEDLIKMPPPTTPIPKREWKDEKVGIVRPSDRSHPGWLPVPSVTPPASNPSHGLPRSGDEGKTTPIKPSSTVNYLTPSQAYQLESAGLTVPAGVTVTNPEKKRRRRKKKPAAEKTRPDGPPEEIEERAALRVAAYEATSNKKVKVTPRSHLQFEDYVSAVPSTPTVERQTSTKDAGKPPSTETLETSGKNQARSTLSWSEEIEKKINEGHQERRASTDSTPNRARAATHGLSSAPRTIRTGKLFGGLRVIPTDDRDVAHYACHGCGQRGHFIAGCTNPWRYPQCQNCARLGKPMDQCDRCAGAYQRYIREQMLAVRNGAPGGVVDLVSSEGETTPGKPHVAMGTAPTRLSGNLLNRLGPRVAPTNTTSLLVATPGQNAKPRITQVQTIRPPGTTQTGRSGSEMTTPLSTLLTSATPTMEATTPSPFQRDNREDRTPIPTTLVSSGKVELPLGPSGSLASPSPTVPTTGGFPITGVAVLDWFGAYYRSLEGVPPLERHRLTMQLWSMIGQSGITPPNNP